MYVLPFCHLRVERIAQAVAHKVAAKNGKEDQQSWHEDQLGIDIEEALAVANHIAPARNRDYDAEAKVTENRLQNNIAAHQQGGIDDNWADGVGQNMAEHHAETARSHRLRGTHELALLQGQKFATDQAGRGCPTKDRDQRDDGGRRAVGERRGEYE